MARSRNRAKEARLQELHEPPFVDHDLLPSKRGHAYTRDAARSAYRSAASRNEAKSEAKCMASENRSTVACGTKTDLDSP